MILYVEDGDIIHRFFFLKLLVLFFLQLLDPFLGSFYCSLLMSSWGNLILRNLSMHLENVTTCGLWKRFSSLHGFQESIADFTPSSNASRAWWLLGHVLTKCCSSSIIAQRMEGRPVSLHSGHSRSCSISSTHRTCNPQGSLLLALVCIYLSHS